LSLVCHGNSVLCNNTMGILLLTNSFKLATHFFNDEFCLRALYLSEMVRGHDQCSTNAVNV